MPYIKTVKELYRIHDKTEKYKEQIIKLNNEIRKEEKIIESIFSKKFKIRGIKAKVDQYSIEDNIIILKPSLPDCGIDVLVLSFKEFAEQVEFINE